MDRADGGTKRGHSFLPSGVTSALAAAALFGLATPLAKWLLGDVSPGILAGLFYLGSGAGLGMVLAVRAARGVRAPGGLIRADLPWLAAAVTFGGVAGPLLLMIGLRLTAASTASLLLNLEGVFTALLARFLFHENVDRRIALGMLLIVAGGALLSGGSSGPLSPGTLAIAGACLCWGLDNNLTQKISASDAVQIAAVKGAVAGPVNLAIAAVGGAALPAVSRTGAALAVGFAGYGLSLVLYVKALRQIGAARTGAYFALGPFAGTAASILLLQEPLRPSLAAAALLMGIGVWLHFTERHVHRHAHERIAHSHPHVHDTHHQHAHPPGIDPAEPHTHFHEHTALTHSHPHYPDIHHRHAH